MEVDYAQVRKRSAEVAQAMAAVRSARNLISRRTRAEEQEERVAEGARRRYKAVTDREADAFIKRRIRIKVAETDRPKNGARTPRKLFHRMVEQLLRGTTGSSNSRGPDGRHAIHYSFTARGFASKTGRRWRAGEAERAALYTVREDALEGGELGWWSNIAEDRHELAAYCRTLEAVEKHDRANANVYIVEVIALPAELTPLQRREAVKQICAPLERRGLAYAVGIHMPDAAGDQRNFHLHLVYSTRPCRRVAAYDWDFAAAKQTDINTPIGIVNRRGGVVVAMNTALRAAGIDKRYTSLSNRDRGMEPPTCGKVGQEATWTSRRLAAVEHRQASLTKLGDKVRGLRDQLITAATRLAEARVLVVRRCIQMSIALAHDVQDVAAIPDLRDPTRSLLEDKATTVGRMMATASDRMVFVRCLAQIRLQRMMQWGADATDPANLMRVRNGVMSGVAVLSPQIATIAENAAALLAAARLRAARTEEADLGLEIERDPVPTPIDHADPADVPLQTTPVAIDPSAVVREAAAARHRELRDRALSRLKDRRAAIKRDAAGRFVADLDNLLADERRALLLAQFDAGPQKQLATMFAEQSASVSTVDVDASAEDHHLPAATVTSPAPIVPAANPNPNINDRKENDHERSTRTQNQAVRRKHRELKAIGGLAGVRVVSAIGVDARPSDSTRILPDARGADIRGGSAVHLFLRGPRTDRVTEAGPDARPQVSAPAPPEPALPTPPVVKVDIFDLAKSVGAAAKPVAPKGPDRGDPPNPPARPGQGR